MRTRPAMWMLVLSVACGAAVAASCLRQRMNSRGWFIPSTATGFPASARALNTSTCMKR